MHPVIRIASFLVIAISLAKINQQQVTTAALLMLLFFFIQPSLNTVRQTTRLVLRLRWLFISIFIVYAWFTPGMLLIPEWGGLSPYKEGSVMGLMRITALIIIISAVCILVLNQPREQIMGAIHWYCRPLRLLGVSQERLAARLVLTMESVSKLESRWTKTANIAEDKNYSLQNQYQRVLQLFKEVVNSAETDELRSISFTLLAPPKWYQWLIPFSLLFIFWIVK